MQNRNRRSLLKSIGTVAIGSIGVSGTAAATSRAQNGNGRGRGFPPKGITDWGESIKLGDGEITAFSSVTPSGNPKAVGIHLADGTLDALPYEEDFENGEVEGRKIHGVWSKPFSLDFPDSTPDPISYAGCGWNPSGHTPVGVYNKPHFDFHYHFYESEVVNQIAPGVIEDLSDEKIPDGYQLIEGGAVIPAMGAHLAPEDAPEFNDRNDPSDWQETLIWGAADVDGDGEYENNYVEPMITVDYFQNHLDGVEKQDISQPAVYPKNGYYPTTYTVRDLGDGGYAVVMEGFEEHSS